MYPFKFTGAYLHLRKLYDLFSMLKTDAHTRALCFVLGMTHAQTTVRVWFLLRHYVGGCDEQQQSN